MTCNKCGEKPKKSCGAFPKAVIEIDNPETITLLRKVVIPASMGDDNTLPPVVGKYRNVILYYEATNRTYLYSSDGIPTAIEAEVPKDVMDRIEALEDGEERLQQEIDDLRNSPDVVDIVATYADLLAYDTSSLTDNDIIRVLTDETHDEASSYYRWNKPDNQWVFIGITGPYYTKTETDSLLNEKQDKLTAGNGIAISNTNVVSADLLQTTGTNTGKAMSQKAVSDALASKQGTLTAGENITISGNTISATDTTYSAGNAIHIDTEDNNRIDADIYPADYFTADGTVGDCGKTIVLDGTIPTTLANIQMKGETTQQPDPTPTAPKDVQVVTGEQSIVVSDGNGESMTYIINLESIELCKILGYQDYLYFHDGGWYIHKETGRYTFNGNEAGWYIPNHTTYPHLFQIENLDLGLPASYTLQALGGAYCKYFTQLDGNNVRNNEGFAIYNSGNTAIVRMNNSAYSSLNEFKAWLADNNVTIYYAVSASTEEKIIDSSLIEQLNALSKAKGYSPKTNITISSSGTGLAAELCVEASVNSAAGIINALSLSDRVYTAGNAIKISGDNVISAMVYPEDFFTAEATKEMEGDIFEVSGTANLHVKDLDIRGNTYQYNYAGVNLLKAPFRLRRDNWQYPATQDWLNIVYTGDELVPPDGTLQRLFIYERNTSDYDITLAAGKYVLCANFNTPARKVPKLVITSGGQEYYTTPDDRYVINIPTGITVDSFYYEIPAGYTDLIVSPLQLCIIPEDKFKGFEPYTSLMPSPNPLSPQRLFTVTGDQIVRAANGNLYNYQDVATQSSTASADADGWITFAIPQNARYSNYFSHNLSLKENTEYSLIVEVKAVTNSSSFRGIDLATSGHPDSQISRGAYISGAELIPGAIKVYRIKTKADFSLATIGLRTYADKYYEDPAASVTIRISVSPNLDMTPSKFRYQKYLGQETLVNLGANLFDKNNATYNLNQSFNPGQTIQASLDGQSMVLYIPCDAGTEYWVMSQENVGLDTRIIGITESTPAIGVSVWSYLGTDGLGDKEIEIPVGSKARYIAIYYHAETGETISGILSDILGTLQIERTQRQIGYYSAYFPPIELYKLGDAQDKIYRDGLTDWVLHKETKKVVYTGSEGTWAVNTANHTASIAHGGGILLTDYLCTHFRADADLSEDNTFSVDSTNITFKSSNVITGLQDWLDWLSINPISVVLGLETPTETTLTDPQVTDGLVRMRNIICYPDFTIFSADGSESANAQLRVEAYLNSLQGLSAAIRDIPICC